jgi:hypothetical protein
MGATASEWPGITRPSTRSACRKCARLTAACRVRMSCPEARSARPRGSLTRTGRSLSLRARNRSTLRPPRSGLQTRAPECQRRFRDRDQIAEAVARHERRQYCFSALIVGSDAEPRPRSTEPFASSVTRVVGAHDGQVRVPLPSSRHRHVAFPKRAGPAGEAAHLPIPWRRRPRPLRS